MKLRPAVIEALSRHGIRASPGDTAESLRERLNELYLEDVRRLRQRQRSAEIPLSEYAGRVEALKRGYPLLALPVSQWVE